MHIGERIKEARNKLDKSQVELAAEIGVSKQTLYKYENGIITNIPSDKIEAIAKACNVSPAYIMGWKETGKTDSDSIKIIDEENNVVVLDDDALALIDSLRARPEMKMLFSVSKNATTEDILKAVKIIEALKDN